jgi:hypothetical protein
LAGPGFRRGPDEISEIDPPNIGDDHDVTRTRRAASTRIVDATLMMRRLHWAYGITHATR